jgi:death-on-curing protein
MNPIFLTLEEVLEIHGHQIELHGGDPGIRDLDLLESAIAQPWSGFDDEYFHKNPYEMAAAYLYHITQNHPFVDGNKRTGAQAADVFLGLNDIDLVCAPSDLEEMVRSVACGEMQKPEIAEFFRKHLDQAIGESAKER